MIVVVGGHSRSVGKTAVVAGLIAELPQYRWTAVKITQFGHGVCAKDGDDCECATDPDHPFALTRERDAESGTDTARYLLAGAAESFWLRTRAGELGFAVPALRRLIARAADVIIESNSVLQFVRPDVYLVVLDPANADFKATSRRYLDRADAFLLRGALPGKNPWETISSRFFGERPAFPLGPDFSVGIDALEFIEMKRTALCSALH